MAVPRCWYRYVVVNTTSSKAGIAFACGVLLYMLGMFTSPFVNVEQETSAEQSPPRSMAITNGIHSGGLKNATLSPITQCRVTERWQDKVQQTTFTVVILSHDRVQVLTDTVKHYARMTNVSLVSAICYSMY